MKSSSSIRKYSCSAPTVEVILVEAVSPKIVAISCGKDNKYGLPDEEVLDIYEKNGITYYRTDERGSLVFSSDGAKVTLKSTTK